MKDWRRYMTKKELRREGRKFRKWQRLNKWLETEACEALKIIEALTRELNGGMPKVGTKMPTLAKALVHVVPVEQLKKYLGFSEWWEKNELYLEIQNIINGNVIDGRIECLICDIITQPKEKDFVKEKRTLEHFFNFTNDLWLIDKELRISYESEISYFTDYLPNLAIALSYSIPKNILKHYLDYRNWDNNLNGIKEITQIVEGTPVSQKIIAKIEELKRKSIETGLPLEQVANDELFNSVVTMLDNNRNHWPKWIEFVLQQFESWEYKAESHNFLSCEISMFNNPYASDLMKSICIMGLKNVIIDFAKWDESLRISIAEQLDVLPCIDDIKFHFPDKDLVNDELDQERWELIWCNIYERLPEAHRRKLKPSFDINDLPNKEEIKKFIKDFELTTR